MGTAEPSTQTAAERRSAEAEVDALIAKFAPTHQGLVAAVRRSVRKRLPTAHEIVYEYRNWFVLSYAPSDRGYEGVLAIRGDTEGVKLYFNRGKELPDPDKLLKGSASLVRFIDVAAASTLTRPAVARLMEEAIARTPVPFVATGRGPVVLRSAATKKRRPEPSKAKRASGTRPAKSKRPPTKDPS